MTEDQTKLASGHDDHFAALHSGFLLGKYELQAVLGQGGFGITYKAWDSELKRAVAIKEYLPSDVAVRVDGSTVRARSRNDEEGFQWGLERFLDEARALARFDHSASIVRVYDYMQANGTAYMIMALVDGTPLSAVYRREAPLDEQRLKAIVLPILDGLDEVHQAGFLHRDIKPANILIRSNGQPVLIDFGAARQALGEKSRSITSVFTPGYAPFEQYTSSGKQGPWTDIYALAATLYHGISGKAPPQATDRIREDPMEPAVRVGAGRYSPQFLAAIDRGLEVFENRRPQNIAHWRDMLSGAISLPVPPVQPGMAPVAPAAGYDAPRTQSSQGAPSQPPTAVPTLNEYGVPSQAPAPFSQGGPQSQAPRAGKNRLGLIAAVVALVLVGGGAAAFFALSGGTSQQSVSIANETPQQRAQRLAEEAKVAAEQARKAQEAAEAEIQRQAEQEARRKAQEEERRRADAEIARQAEQARREADRAQRENDGEAKRRAEEQTRRLAEAEAQRKAESEKLEQERKDLEAARAKAEAELAEARRQAEEARKQADAMRAQAEKERVAAEELHKRQEAEAKARAEAEAKRKAEAEAKAKAEAEAKAKAEAEAKRKAEADAKARAEAEAKKKAEAEAKARADAERQRQVAAAPPAQQPAPPPPVTSADVRNAPAPQPQQQAAASAAPGYVYAGRYRVTVDCPQVDQPPFAQFGTSIKGPQFTWNFYRDGVGTGTISGDSMSYQINFTGRNGNYFTGKFNLRANGENFRGSGVVSGFGPSHTAEKSCPITFEKQGGVPN